MRKTSFDFKEVIDIQGGLVLALSASMKTVIIVSKCSRVTKFNFDENLYEFHFKGVCAGENIKKIILQGRIDFNIKAHEEYLIYAQMIAFEKGILRGKILRCKLLSECWDKSSQR